MNNDLARYNPWNWFRQDDNWGQRGSSSAYGLPSYPASYFGQMSEMYRHMDRFFDNAFGQFNPFSANAVRNVTSALTGMDIKTSDREYTISFDTPGCTDKDLRVSLAGDNMLMIRGEKRQTTGSRDRENDQGQSRSESSFFSSFERMLPLPQDVMTDEISAACENGVLTLTLPRKEQSQQRNRTIPVGANGERAERSERQESRTGEQNRHTGSSGSSGSSAPNKRATAA